MIKKKVIINNKVIEVQFTELSREELEALAKKLQRKYIENLQDAIQRRRQEIEKEG